MSEKNPLLVPQSRNAWGLIEGIDYKTNEDGSTTSFLFDPDNTDYQEFLRWCSEGNTPLPADE